MTNQFKIPFYFPLPKKRVDIDQDLPRFDNSLIVKHDELGKGSMSIGPVTMEMTLLSRSCKKLVLIKLLQNDKVARFDLASGF